MRYEINASENIFVDAVPETTIHRPAAEQVQLMQDLTGPDAGVAECAFDEFYHDYNAVLIRRADELLYPVEGYGWSRDAESLVQDAWQALWLSREDLNPNSTRVYTWLLNVIRNRSANEIRNARVRNTAVTDMSPAAARLADDEDATPTWEPTDGGPTPEEAALENETASLVAEALRVTLSDVEREIFVARHVDKTPIKDIADRHGIKVNTVKSRLSTAKRKLAEWLGPRTGRGDVDS